MSPKEEEQLKRLQAKKRQEQREAKKFKDVVISRRDDVIKILGLDGVDEKLKGYDQLVANERAWHNLARKYGISEQELYEWVGSDSQISYFKNHGSVAKVKPARDSQ